MKYYILLLGLCLLSCKDNTPLQTSVTVNVSKAGTLDSLLSQYRKEVIDTLVVTGEINEWDMITIQNMDSLSYLDLEETTIKHIQPKSFMGNDRIRTVILPDGISVGYGAFSNCKNLKIVQKSEEYVLCEIIRKKEQYVDEYKFKVIFKQEKSSERIYADLSIETNEGNIIFSKQIGTTSIDWLNMDGDIVSIDYTIDNTLARNNQAKFSGSMFLDYAFFTLVDLNFDGKKEILIQKDFGGGQRGLSRYSLYTFPELELLLDSNENGIEIDPYWSIDIHNQRIIAYNSNGYCCNTFNIYEWNIAKNELIQRKEVREIGCYQENDFGYIVLRHTIFDNEGYYSDHFEENIIFEDKTLKGDYYSYRDRKDVLYRGLKYK